MSKVKLKKIRMPVGGKDDDLSSMFNQMLGTGTANMSIAYPKYQQLKSLTEQISKVISLIADSPLLTKMPGFASQRAELTGVSGRMSAHIQNLFTVDYTEYVWNLELLSTAQKEAFGAAYDAVKKSVLIQELIATCDRLTPYRINFDEQDKISHLFINNMPGVEWCPFVFSTLNLKEIFSLPEVKENTIRFFMMTIHKIYQLTRKIWELISTPDVDVNQFVDVIMTNIEYLQKRPELSRCKKAFSKIRSSVDLLKERFNGYYRDFVETKESTIIFEHFILDVSNTTNVDPQEIAQFRIIIDYYRKIAQQQAHNPQIAGLFKKVEESFKAMEANAPNLAREDRGQAPMPEPIPEDALPAEPTVETRENVTEKSIGQLMHEINSCGRKKKGGRK